MVKMRVVVMMMVVMVVVIMVDGARREHRNKNERRGRRQHNKKASVPEEFSQWHQFNERFLAHLSRQPSQLNEDQIKPHLNTLLVDLDFLPQVNQYLDTHLANVSTEEQARRVFTLLDLYSAQEPLKLRYVKQMREALVSLFERCPEIIKDTVTINFILDGFDRHAKGMERRSLAMYRRVLVASPSNLNLLAYYWPGRQPSLDQAFTRHNLSAPFLGLDEAQWYQVKLADPPHLTLSIDLLTWRLLLVNHTFSPTLFRFQAVAVSLKAERYLLKSAVLSPQAHLAFPCHHHHALCFDYQNGANLEVVGLPDGEAALIHKQKGRAFFLQYSREGRKGRAAYPKVPEPRMTHGYPGRGAHWVLAPLKNVAKP